MGTALRVQSAASAAVDMIQREFPNYHPIVALARMAHKPEVIAEPRLEFEIHKALLPYVSPKLSAVEVTQQNTDDRRVIVSLFETRQLENGSTVEVEVPLVTDVSEIVRLD